MSALLATGASFATPTFAQDAAKAKPLRLSVAVGPAFALGKSADIWAKLVTERSRGAFAVDVHPGATLAQRDPDREFAALRDGAADLAVGSTLHWSVQVNELVVVGLPWLAPERDDLVALATGTMQERLFAAITRAGAVPLALAPLDHRAIATRSNAVRTVDDLRGQKLRTTSSPYLVDFYSALGALPFAMPFADAANQFRAGALDAQEGPVATFAAIRVDGLGLRNVTLWDAVAELAIFAVNRAVWEKWTIEQRALVQTAALAAAQELATLAAAEHETALTTLKNRDVGLLRLTASGRAAFAAAARPVYEKWAAVAREELVRAAESAVMAAKAAR
jgi:TRAP-type C4-dicarboxylate transport system substrate-binding protein